MTDFSRYVVLALVLVTAFDPTASSVAKEPYLSESDGRSIGGATGAPKADAWRQEIDYKIEARLDEDSQSISGSALIVYRNNSPFELDALYLAGEESGFSPEAIAMQAGVLPPMPGIGPVLPAYRLVWDFAKHDQPAGQEIKSVSIDRGPDLAFADAGGVVRVVLPSPLAPGDAVTLRIEWVHRLGDFHHVIGRNGYEYFPETGTYQFSVGRWFPRIVPLTENGGWDFRAFLGDGEFFAEFADFDVTIDVPEGHVVAATGELANAARVLTRTQRKRLQRAIASQAPVFIITPEEAKANDAAYRNADASMSRRRWRFTASNVRGFAWASSPKFVWDAAAFRQDDPDAPLVRVQSLYPYEASGLWSRYSTEAALHALNVYSRLTIPYPYPVMSSINAYSQMTGVEYPMIGFTGPRPYYDYATGLAQYGAIERDALVELVIHETGHTYFPLIVSSDERRFAWMDEGLNTALNHIAVAEWDDRPGVLFGGALEASFRQALVAEPRRPLMTPHDEMPNAFATVYFKAAGALLLLREEILGRTVFDDALRRYAEDWRFRHVGPEDFFRAMETRAGRDLSWFWADWFYSDKHLDFAIDRVVRFSADETPSFPPRRQSAGKPAGPPPPDSLTVRAQRAAGVAYVAQSNEALADYYSGDAPNAELDDAPPPIPEDPWFSDRMSHAQRAWPFVYGLTLKNVGGLRAPLQIRLEYVDGTNELRAAPVEIWRYGDTTTLPVYASKEVSAIVLDPERRLPDADEANNRLVGPFDLAPILPLRPQRDPRGEMGRSGVGVDAYGRLHKEQ